MDRKSITLLIALGALTLLTGGVALGASSALLSHRGDVGQSHGEVPFPAKELRTAKTPPAFTLTDQNGEAASLEQARGKIVIITAVYATCHTACPTIISTLKAAVNRLTDEQRAQVEIIAITLDPEGDTQAKRAATAQAHNLQAPLFRYVNGDDPAAVLSLLTDLGWARAAVPDSDVIGHSNLFMLVDRKGKIAYTLSADGQLHWLDQGLQTLLKE